MVGTKSGSPIAGVRVARVSTVAFFVETQLKRQIDEMIGAGMLVTVIASERALRAPIQGAVYKSINIPREINLFRDLLAVFKLASYFRSNSFDIVHSTTPKAGLVTALAAYMARVPVRIHTYTGQVWVEKSGIVRRLAKWADQLIARLNTQCYADSPSQMEFLIKNRVTRKGKICCLGYGSLAGVDLIRFNTANYAISDRLALKTQLHISTECKVVTFIGRCTKDKGIGELLKAFERVAQSGVKVVLLIVGPVEGDALAPLDRLEESVRNDIRLIGSTQLPERYLSISDLLLLPSYREGFGTVIIEAAAMGIPAIGTQIYGLQDAIAHNKTGCLVPPKEVYQLAEAMQNLLIDDKRRHEMGAAAIERARKLFSSAYVNQLLLAEYERLIAEHGRKR